MNFDYLEKMNPSPLAVVIDIETEGRAVNSIIATIGCVIVNLFTGKVLSSFYIRCDTINQQDYRTVDEGTQQWWEEQREEHSDAYSEAFNPHLNRVELSQALVKLNSFIYKHLPNRPKVIGNGPEFDNAILVHAMDSFGIKPAWDHGCNQSLRTVVLLGRLLLGYDPKYEIKFIGTKHHALDDALHEAEYLYLIFKTFIERLSRPEKSTFTISKDRLLSLLEVFELNNSEDINPDNGKAHRAIVELFFEEFNLIGE